MRQGLQRAYLDNAADAAPGCRLGEQPVEQRDGLAWAVLREQHPRQHQIFPLLRAAWSVVRAEAALLDPAGSRGGVTLGEQQPRPLRGHRIGKARSGGAWRDPPGLTNRVERPRCITSGLPDPRQGGHTRDEEHVMERTHVRAWLSEFAGTTILLFASVLVTRWLFGPHSALASAVAARSGRMALDGLAIGAVIGLLIISPKGAAQAGTSTRPSP